MKTYEVIVRANLRRVIMLERVNRFIPGEQLNGRFTK